VSPVARFDTDEKFWADWDRQWLLYGTVYAVNLPEPRVVPANTLTIHEGPCPVPPHPDGTMEDALNRSSNALSKAVIENQRLRGWLQRIVDDLGTSGYSMAMQALAGKSP